MNLLLGVCCLILCTYLGYYLSKKYSLRSEFFDNFCEFNKNLKSDISFMQNSILSIVKRYENSSSIFYSNIYKKFYKNDEINLDYKIFKNEEIEMLKSYLDNIGNLDKHTQIKFLESFEVKINKLYELAKEEEKKYKTLYIKLGFLAGLIALIILL